MILEMPQTKGLHRNSIDKYYTSEEVVIKCMKEIEKHLDIEAANDLCIEPSAGNGAFISRIDKLFNNALFYDIEPDHLEIKKQDFISLNIDISNFRKVHVLGNPPFGRQSTMAIKFIKKACEFADSVSFILPKSFKKESMQKHFPLNFYLIHEWDIPFNSFIVDGKPHDVPCVFQIWEYRKEPRDPIEKLSPKGYKFVKQTENPDLSFRRVGFKAGEISSDTENKSHQSHYFIKLEDDINETKMKELKNINFKSKDNTVGARSISKQELIKEFNMIF